MRVVSIIGLVLILTGCGTTKVLVDQKSCKVKYTTVDGKIVQECEEATDF